jgi:hypothetical protein
MVKGHRVFRQQMPLMTHGNFLRIGSGFRGGGKDRRGLGGGYVPKPWWSLAHAGSLSDDRLTPLLSTRFADNVYCLRAVRYE